MRREMLGIAVSHSAYPSEKLSLLAHAVHPQQIDPVGREDTAASKEILPPHGARAATDVVSFFACVPRASTACCTPYHRWGPPAPAAAAPSAMVTGVAY